MTEYIKRSAVFEQFDNADADVCETDDFGGVDYGFGMKNIKELINAIHAADVAPVVHGRWIDKGEYAVCTECGGRSGTHINDIIANISNADVEAMVDAYVGEDDFCKTEIPKKVRNLGWVDPMTDDPLPECLTCPDFVNKAQDDLEAFYGRADNG